MSFFLHFARGRPIHYQDTIAHFAGGGAHKAQMARRHLFALLIGAMMAGAYTGFGDIILFTTVAHAPPAWAHPQRRRQARPDFLAEHDFRGLGLRAFGGEHVRLLDGVAGPAPANLALEGATRNEVWVTLGNLAGGGVMAAAGYLLQRGGHAREPAAAVGSQPAESH